MDDFFVREVTRLAHFLRIDLERHVLLYQENVINLVFAPSIVAGGVVVNSEDICEVLELEAGSRDAQLVVQLANSRSEMTSTATHLPFDAPIVLHIGLPVHVQRMTAARIRPVERERDFLARPSLQQQPSIHIEKKDTKGAMTQSRSRFLVSEMTCS